MLNEEIIIFGAGDEGKNLLGRIGADRVKCFVDNNEKLQSCHIHSKRIISINELTQLYKSNKFTIVISSRKYYLKISQQLVSVGINEAVSVSRFLIEDAFKGRAKERRILLVNTHVATNIGDHLISEAELSFFSAYLPEFTVIELTADLIDEDIETIKKFVLCNDIVAISGGGYMGSLWKSYGEDNVRSIISHFPNNRIIVLPQSIFFENTPDGKHELEISKRIYSMHNQLYICARESNSYRVLKKMLGRNDKTILLPDMVAFFDESKNIIRRKSVGLCIRSDKESILSFETRKKLKDMISDDVTVFDMHAEQYIYAIGRKAIVKKYIELVSGMKYVITDRLHCMLLCVVTGTPCLAFDNISGKITGVYEWIKGNNYIHIADSIDSVKEFTNFYKNNQETFRYDQKNILSQFDRLAALFK